MPVTYTGGTNQFRRNFMDRPTKHGTHEIVLGDRYSPWLQIQYGEGALRVAPYLPFDRIVKDYYTYSVMRAFTVASVDQQGYIVPANGILPVASAADFYEGRPLVYAAKDYDSTAFGDWPDTDAPVNVNPFDGELLAAGDVNTEGVCNAAASTDATAGGIAGLTFAFVKSGSMPIGVVTDELMEGASRFTFNEFDPQESVTIQTMYTLAVPETTAMRYNYGQATRNAIILRDSLVGQPAGVATDLGLQNVSGVNGAADNLTALPFWAVQGVTDQTTATENDMIVAGDLVSCDDSGNMVRFDARIDDWNMDAAGGPGSPSDLEMNGRYPVAAVAAIVGRCHNRQKVVASTPLSKVKTYQNQLLGGSGTGGIEAWATRGNSMTAGEVTAITEVRKPSYIGGSGLGTSAYAALDVEAGEKFALLVHLTMM